ncbi:peroxiredoxin [Lacrimispora sp. 38-1]|uniref:peroxiredoxin n=1 Tax=Lacrimispora sp. 38-1 TaxID=3125778 RepID=UPI003CEC8BDE
MNHQYSYSTMDNMKENRCQIKCLTEASKSTCIKVGDLAPDFSLEGVFKDEKIIINLSELNGKWIVIFFYSSDFGIICSTELSAITRKINEFSRLNTIIVGISTDSIYTHKIFNQVTPTGRAINFPLLSDRSHKVSKEYDVLNEKEGFTYRATLIIDTEGVIQAILTNPTNVGRNIDEIIRILEALQYNKQTGLAIPANWQYKEPGIERDWNRIGRY